MQKISSSFQHERLCVDIICSITFFIVYNFSLFDIVYTFLLRYFITYYSLLTHYSMCKFLFMLDHFHFVISTITHHFTSPRRISLRVLPVRDFAVRTSRFTHSHIHTTKWDREQKNRNKNRIRILNMKKSRSHFRNFWQLSQVKLRQSISF